jgi:sodium/bile acid cotransporter 7
MRNSAGTPATRAFRPDPFIIALLITVALGLLLPARGVAADILSVVKVAGITLIFFLQGMRLERDAVIRGMMHWRLQLLTLGSTFVVAPVVGFILFRAFPGFLDETLWLGVLFLCALPSTVQSSVGFTSIARGNVAAAICAATASNLLGVVLTPLLVAVLLKRHSDISPLEQIQAIVLQLLVPFIAGQIVSPWLRPWAIRHPQLITITDRGLIMLVVYAAFSAAVLAGAWSVLQPMELVKILGLSVVLLANALLFTRFACRALRFAKPDEIAVVFCGSQKSLVSGVPMANILFPAALAGVMLLPAMVFHQLQLMVSATLSRRYAERAEVGAPSTSP